MAQAIKHERLSGAVADMEAVDILHITDCCDGGVPAVIDLLLTRPRARALFLGRPKAALKNAHLCSAVVGYERSFVPWKMWRALRQLRASILDINPRMIHLHSSYAGLLGALVSWSLRRPVLYTPHASSMMIPDPSLSVRFIRQLERLTVLSSSCVIACSRDEAELFRWSRRPVMVIANAVPDVEMDALRARLDRALEYEFDVLGIGRDSAQKDLEQFSQIADELSRRRPGIRIGWLGAEARPGLSSAVSWLGYVSEQRVNQALVASRVFLATSRYEGFSVAAIKAAMAGCELVLRDKPGTRALAHDGVRCHLYGSPEECVSRVEATLDLPSDERVRKTRMELARRLYSQARQLRWTSRIYQLFI